MCVVLDGFVVSVCMKWCLWCGVCVVGVCGLCVCGGCVRGGLFIVCAWVCVCLVPVSV